MESSQFCLKPDERVNVKWQWQSQLNLHHFVYKIKELYIWLYVVKKIDKHSVSELP